MSLIMPGFQQQSSNFGDSGGIGGLDKIHLGFCIQNFLMEYLPKAIISGQSDLIDNCILHLNALAKPYTYRDQKFNDALARINAFTQEQLAEYNGIAVVPERGMKNIERIRTQRMFAHLHQLMLAFLRHGVLGELSYVEEIERPDIKVETERL